MGFALFIIYLLLTFVRPAEHFPALRDWEIMDIASVLALAGAAVAVLAGNGPRFRAAQIPLLLALLMWTALSVMVSPLRSVGAFDGVIGFFKSSVTAFMLVILNVTTARRLRLVAVTLTVSALFLAAQAVSEHRRLGTAGSQAQGGDLRVPDSVPDWEEAQPQETEEGASYDPAARIWIVGRYGDPNDLALTLIAILPFALALRRPHALVRNALVVWIPIALIVYGIFLTRSRGGVLALACVLGLLVRNRIGTALSAVGAAGALIALLALGFHGGRTMSIDESVQSRIDAWSGGLQMLKSSPVWGVGLGMFTENYSRAAHSSFVECFAELGLVGYILWLSLILLTLDDMRSLGGSANEAAAELRRWARAVGVGLIGFLVGAIFLSRAFDAALFILLGLGTAIGDFARRQGHLAESRNALAWTYVVSAVAGTSIMAYWLYMRLGR